MSLEFLTVDCQSSFCIENSVWASARLGMGGRSLVVSRAKREPESTTAMSQARANLESSPSANFLYFWVFKATEKQFQRRDSSGSVHITHYTLQITHLASCGCLKCSSVKCYKYFSTQYQFPRCFVELERMSQLFVLNRGRNSWGQLIDIEGCS